MYHTRPTRTTRIAFATVLAACAAASAQEVRAPVDGARRVDAQPARPPATLVAPDMAAMRIELPPTMVPADVLNDARRRASDLNGDGIVNQTDLDQLKKTFGPCVAGQPCPGDLDLNQVVDDADAAILQQHLGETVGGNEAQAERVGNVLPAPPGLLPPIPLQARADGNRVIKLELRSANARALRIQLSAFRRSALQLRVYNPTTKAVIGPYQSPRLAADGTWWSPTIFGDTIGLEFNLPADAAVPDQMPSISAVGYLFCDSTQCSFAPGATLGCHNDITCTPSWATAEGRAIALIYFVSGGGCARCSGSLLNRGPGDFSPLFSTANHCISTQAEADSVDFIWFFDTASCNGAPPVDGIHNLGSLLLKRHSGSDEILLGLYEQPATNFYIGSDPNNWGSGDGATGVHHPRGTFKRISTGTSAGSTDNALFCEAGGPVACTCGAGINQCIAVDVWNVSYTSGTTEPGSSGSPVFDSSRRMRGTLTGGPSGCPTIVESYGRYDLAYANLRFFIDGGDVPASTVFVNGGVAGDAGQNGNSERGTNANPFNTVYEASFCVRSGTTVTVSPGNYNEQMTIWRPMTISRSGVSGTVTIGAP